KKRGQHLVAHQGPDDIARDYRKAAPVGAELIGQHDAGNDAHRERDGKDLGPEMCEPVIVLALLPQPQHFKRGDVGRKPDREGRKDDVERYREGKLNPREMYRIELHRSLRRNFTSLGVCTFTLYAPSACGMRAVVFLNDRFCKTLLSTSKNSEENFMSNPFVHIELMTPDVGK